MSRQFFVEEIKDKELLNKITKDLTNMAEVSRINVAHGNISFYCDDPEAIHQVFIPYNNQLIVRELVRNRKQIYQPIVPLTDKAFLLSKLGDQEQVQKIKDALSRYDVYHNVEIDLTNRMIKLKTKEKVTLTRIKRIINRIDDSIEVEEVENYLKPENIFDEKYLKTYLILAILFVALALGIITRNEMNLVTDLSWLAVVILISRKLILEAFASIRGKDYFADSVLKVLALFFGWLFAVLTSNFVLIMETVFVAVLIYGSQHLYNYLTLKTINKIDKLVDTRITVKRLVGDDVEEVEISDVDLDDILVYEDGDNVVLGGDIISGKCKIDNYALDGSDILMDSTEYQKVKSGMGVVDGILKVQVTDLNYKTAQQRALEVASTTSISKSDSYILIEKISHYYTYVMLIIACICTIVVPIYDFEAIYFMYIGTIIITMSWTAPYKQAGSMAVFAGVIRCLKNNIVIKENTGLDDLSSVNTIIYDRFDGVEVTQQELDIFKELKGLNKDFIVFNDGPVDLENDQFDIRNNLDNAEKAAVLEKQSLIGPVAYIGDCDKDVSLLRKAYVGISRGGIANRNIMANSDIILMDSSLDTLMSLFDIAKRQKVISLFNILLGLIVSVVVVLLSISITIMWSVAVIITIIETVFVLINIWRIVER